MKKNVGLADRIFRLLAAAIIIVLYASGVVKGMFANVLLVVALAFIVSGAVGFCGFYKIFGINSCSSSSVKTPPEP